MKKTNESDIELQKSTHPDAGSDWQWQNFTGTDLAKILEVPFRAICRCHHADRSRLCGRRCGNILLRLIQNADHDVEKTQRGVVYIDEIDKNCQKKARTYPYPGYANWVKGVQQALLRFWKVLFQHTASG